MNRLRFTEEQIIAIVREDVMRTRMRELAGGRGPFGRRLHVMLHFSRSHA
jgi:hypothetical protein